MLNNLREKLGEKNYNILKVFGGLSIFLGIVIFSLWDSSKPIKPVNNSNATTAAKTTTTKETDNSYKPTIEEKSVLKKSYKDIKGDEWKVYNDLETKYKTMSDEKKKSIKTDMERLMNEKTAYNEECKKLSEDNKQTYAKLIKEIESDYSSMIVSNINGKGEEKFLDIDMKLLYNKNATLEEACKLTVMKETAMKESGIKTILISAKDSNGKDSGTLAFELTNGEYKPAVNTLK